MRRILGVATLAVVALIFTLVGVASGSPQAKPAPTANCPSNITNFVAANNVDAYSTSGTTTTTYFFSSLEDQDPSNGVPGLVGYCVYTDGVVQTADATPATWKQ